MINKFGTTVAKITLEAYQVKIEGGWTKAIACLFTPMINIQKEETKKKIQELSEKLANDFSDILDFDNA